MDVINDKFLIASSLCWTVFQSASNDDIILAFFSSANFSATKVLNAFNIIRLNSLCAFILPRFDFVQLVLGRSQKKETTLN